MSQKKKIHKNPCTVIFRYEFRSNVVLPQLFALDVTGNIFPSHEVTVKLPLCLIICWHMFLYIILYMKTYFWKRHLLHIYVCWMYFGKSKVNPRSSDSSFSFHDIWIFFSNIMAHFKKSTQICNLIQWIKFTMSKPVLNLLPQCP